MGSNLESSFVEGQNRPSGSDPLPKRMYRPGVNLSIVGFGGLMLVGMGREPVNRLVAQSMERGVNYFDVAPSYGDGEAEDKLGTALASHRKNIFLASKTQQHSVAGVRLELEQSLRRLRTDYLDLYQFHAVSKAADAEEILAPGGPAEFLLRAREQGLIRFIGFSSHSVPISLMLLNRCRFDSILFPVNFVCYARGNFGPQVLAKARSAGTACVALKSLAHTVRRRLEIRRYPNCWYRPIDDPVLALQAMRFSLSEDVTALLPPGDERLYRMAVELACAVTPLTDEERARLFEGARGVRPILRAGKK
jgi:diketogulonate reductase-like aldo/keto reductase